GNARARGRRGARPPRPKDPPPVRTPVASTHRRGDGSVERAPRAAGAPDRHPAVAVAGVAPAPATVPNLERNWNATSGRQTAAKREYLRSQRVGEWRRGESKPRPKVHPRARLRV